MWPGSHTGAFVCEQRLEETDHPVHQQEVADAAQNNKHVEDLMAAETGIVTAGPLQRIGHAADGIEHAAGQQPGQPCPAHGLVEGINCHNGHPAHGDIDGGGELAGHVDPAHGEDDTGQSQDPDNREQGPAPGTHGAEHTEADGRIAARNQKIDGGVVELAQGDTSADAGVQAVVQGAGGVEPNHGRAVDGKGDDMPGVQTQGDGANQEQYGSQHRKHGADAVGDGGPGTQTVIGVAALFLRTAAGFGGGEAGDRKFGIHH